MRGRCWTVIAVLIFFVALAYIQQSRRNAQDQRPMPPNGRVVYSRLSGFSGDEPPRYDLILFNTKKRKRLVRLTDRSAGFGAAIFYPGFSPDGKSVLFRADEPNDPIESAGLDAVAYHGEDQAGFPLRVMSLSTRRYDTLPKEDSDYEFCSWSPDGRSIAVVAPYIASSQTKSIFIYDVKTGRNQRAAIIHDDISDMSWSPDSQRVLFQLDEKPTPLVVQASSLYAVPRTGGKPGILIKWKGKEDRSGYTYSPDGRRVAFVQGNSVYIAKADGSGYYPAIKPKWSGALSDQWKRPVWSKAGDKLAVANTYSSPYGNKNHTELHVYDVPSTSSTKGRDRILATFDQVTDGIIWSKDGLWLILQTSLYGQTSEQDPKTGLYGYRREGLVAVSVVDGHMVTLKEPNEETMGIDWVEAD